MTEFQPVVLLGAARSGTKILRDLIAQHPDVSKVPFDINYIWRLGNETLEHDELRPESLTEKMRQRIRQRIEPYAENAPYLIEKTVSNTLRVPFVATVYPEAKFIHLVRGGYDVVESAYRQWTAPPDWRYVFRKAKTFPLIEAPRYALRYAVQTYRRLTHTRHENPPTWGPRYEGIESDLRDKTVLEVCALQWFRCIEATVVGLETVPRERILTIPYEIFVQSPIETLQEVADFIGYDSEAYTSQQRSLLSQISKKNIGKGLENLTHVQVERIAGTIERGMAILEVHVATNA